ncbi:MAG TPA: hypothetical protein VHM30_18240 [Gemmatimonadaceae bacterium]|nr:hypothetical protein [Gemmatimonadaceae bacterium]
MERAEERLTSAGELESFAVERTELEADAVVVPLADVSPADLDRSLRAPGETSTLGLAAAAPAWRWTVTVSGTCTRESTTFTDRRRDALLSATRFIEMAKRIVRFEPNRLDASIAHEPGSLLLPNRAGGRYLLQLELRDADAITVGRVYDRLTSEARTIGRLSRTRFDFEPNRANPTIIYEMRGDAMAFPREAAGD